jgi:hypothetical protein
MHNEVLKEATNRVFYTSFCSKRFPFNTTSINVVEKIVGNGRYFVQKDSYLT